MLTADVPVVVPGPLAREMIALGRATDEKPRRAPKAQEAAPAQDDIAALRAEYQAKFGKRPFNGWSAAQLKEKIAEA